MEYLDVYDNDGNLTGRKVLRGDKSEKFNDNEHIAIAIIFIENDKGEFLIQKTSKEKGGEFTSTGGHVDSGETPLEAIKRETKEELGISIDNDKINDYGFLSFDMPLRYLFYVKKNIDVSKLKLQTEEVEYAKYMSKRKIDSLIKTNKMLKSHELMYKRLMVFDLLNNLDKIHTTALGSDRIKKNLKIKDNNVVKHCLNIILDEKSVIYKEGKNIYGKTDKYIVTINSYNYCIITAHVL